MGRAYHALPNGCGGVPGLLNSTMRQIAWTPVLVNMRPIIRPTILADTRITRDGHGNAISGRNIARCIMVCLCVGQENVPRIVMLYHLDGHGV